MPDAFVVVIVFLLSAAAIFGGAYYIILFTRLKRKGAKAEGIIYSYEPDTVNRSTTYYPVVRFVTDKGEWMTAKNKISGYYLPGKKVTVYYNPANPKEFMIDTLQNTILPYIFLSVGIIIFIAAIISLFPKGHLFSFT